MRLSIVIPAYNEEKYINKTLQAIKEGEIIVVCNGCTDKTEEIAKKYADKVIVLEEKGVSRARNTGAKAASNDKIVFLDADIIVDNKVLRKISRSKYNIGTSWVKADSNHILDNTIMFFKSYVHYLGTCTGLIFCDKEIFERVRGFNEKLSKKEDGQFLRKARKIGNFGVVNAYVYNNMRRYRQLGYLNIVLYWIKEYIFPSKKEYTSIR